MLPDPAAVYADRKTALSPPPLDEEERVALARAAVLAGDPGLRGPLAALVLAYANAWGGGAPTRRQLHHQLREVARVAEELRRVLAAGPCVRAALANVTDPAAPDDLDQLEHVLGGLERQARRAALDHDPGDRSSADRSPAGARWQLAWDLAAVWAAAGRRVSIGPDTGYFAFASECFSAAGQELPQRLADEVARRWQSLTPGAGKSTLASFTG